MKKSGPEHFLAGAAFFLRLWAQFCSDKNISVPPPIKMESASDEKNPGNASEMPYIFAL